MFASGPTLGRVVLLVLVVGIVTVVLQGRLHATESNDAARSRNGRRAVASSPDSLSELISSFSSISRDVERFKQDVQQLGVDIGGNANANANASSTVASGQRQASSGGVKAPPQQSDLRVISKAAPEHVPANAPITLDHLNLEDSIFVTIASYRDEQCAPTILDMFQRAKNPHALFVGIVEQHFPGDRPCTPKEFDACQNMHTFCPTDHIQVRRIMPNKARGPTFGRYYGMLMYRGEKYMFMMDSHNRFVTSWDEIIVRMYKGLPTEKGVLSHYPEGWNNPEDGQTNQPLDSRSTTTYLCTAKFIPEGFPRLDGFVVHKGSKPRPQPWAAAGFLFADASIIKEIPFDPNLNYIFDGEEILYSVRMWTHGWDIFSPNENIMYHYYYRTKAKKFWSLLPQDWTVHRDRALRRIQYLLNVTLPDTADRVVPLDTKEEWVTKDLDKYGLGTQRSLEEYYKWAGIDHVKRKIENKWCPRA